jgi:hypothetical protein
MITGQAVATLLLLLFGLGGEGEILFGLVNKYEFVGLISVCCKIKSLDDESDEVGG